MNMLLYIYIYITHWNVFAKGDLYAGDLMLKMFCNLDQNNLVAAGFHPELHLGSTYSSVINHVLNAL